MIRYALQCGNGHPFEGWFGSSGEYDDQQARGLVECPMCASRQIAKQIMAPSVAGTKAQKGPPAEPTPQMQQMMTQAMGEVRRHVEENFDYVGDAFAREARAIHEGRSEERGIYGEASAKQIKALTADGVQIAPLPPAPQPKQKLN